VSQREVISRLPVSDPDAAAAAADSAVSLDVALPLSSLHNVRALAYDVHSHFIYWVDVRTKSIRRARDDGTQVHLAVSVPFSSFLALVSWLFTVYCFRNPVFRSWNYQRGVHG